MLYYSPLWLATDVTLTQAISLAYTIDSPLKSIKYYIVETHHPIATSNRNYSLAVLQKLPPTPYAWLCAAPFWYPQHDPQQHRTD
jgi:hypothetical protein